METTLEVRKTLTTPRLIGEQLSVTAIPQMVYEYLSQSFGVDDEEVLPSLNKQMTKCRELKTENKNGLRVFILYSQEQDGDATETKFALLTWKPFKPQYRDFYEFEIAGCLSGGAWSHTEGYKFTEVLKFGTNTGTKNYLSVSHPISLYVTISLAEAHKLVLGKNVVCQKYVDHNPNPPR